MWKNLQINRQLASLDLCLGIPTSAIGICLLDVYSTPENNNKSHQKKRHVIVIENHQKSIILRRLMLDLLVSDHWPGSIENCFFSVILWRRHDTFLLELSKYSSVEVCRWCLFAHIPAPGRTWGAWSRRTGSWCAWDSLPPACSARTEPPSPARNPAT